MTDWLALWGAVLSRLLGALKAWEIWKGRFRIDVGCLLTGSSELGNTVTIRNLGGDPIIVKYWELLWFSGRWPRRKQSLCDSPGEYATDIHIAPGSSHPLEGAGPDHFEWGARALRGRRLFIRLHIAGKKRRLLRKLCG